MLSCEHITPVHAGDAPAGPSRRVDWMIIVQTGPVWECVVDLQARFAAELMNRIR